jgi:hypothetical protein
VVLCDVVPLLKSGKEVDEFILQHQDFRPDTVVIDTLATGIAGENTNADETAALLCGSGTAGKIQKAFGALVMIPCHEGYGNPGRAKGSSNFPGNVYADWGIEFDNKTSITVTCCKMKDGPSGHSVLFAINEGEIPVPKRICLRSPGETAASKQKPKPEALAEEDFIHAIAALTPGGGFITSLRLYSYVAKEHGLALKTAQNRLSVIKKTGVLDPYLACESNGMTEAMWFNPEKGQADIPAERLSMDLYLSQIDEEVCIPSLYPEQNAVGIRETSP